MPRIIVTPIDPYAPGSFRESRNFWKARALRQEAEAQRDPHLIETANSAIIEFLIPRLRMADGSSVEEFLDTCSLAEFNELLEATGGQTPDPPVNGASSSNGSTGKDLAPNGSISA